MAFALSIWRLSPIHVLVPGALAAALGLEIRSDDPIPGLIAALRGKEMLLVLDNCAAS